MMILAMFTPLHGRQQLKQVHCSLLKHFTQKFQSSVSLVRRLQQELVK
jgi:hypothetical protein